MDWEFVVWLGMIVVTGLAAYVIIRLAVRHALRDDARRAEAAASAARGAPGS